MKITVMPVDAAIRTAVLGLRVRPEQGNEVGGIAVLLGDAEACTTSEPMAILADGTVVGYYQLERAPGTVLAAPPEVPAIGLRAFCIDARWQGLGIGTRALAALREDLRRRCPDRHLLVLTVNCANAVALRAYRRAGFVDAGARIGDGRGGWQQAMRLRLDD